MIARSVAARCVIAAVAGLLASLPATVQAQQSGGTRATTAAGPTVIYSDPGGNAAARKTAKRAPAKRRTTARETYTIPQQREWSLEDALPTRRSDDSGRNIPTISTPQLGRIPLERGSFGFETDNKVKSDELYDGRRAPGLETVKRNDPSYFGLSLSVPSDDKGFVLPAPPWGRP